jgi:hypothetical protein
MISWRHVTRWTRYVPHDQAEDYCRCGWCITDAFENTPHAAYCVLCAWLCQCPPIEPTHQRASLRQGRELQEQP